MRHYVSRVHQYPLSFGVTFYPQNLLALLCEFFLYVVDYSLYSSGRICAAYKEIIRNVA